ncbi:MAG: YiaAB two helix protein [Nocardioidaceae bacterium]|nr:YiaAB two helix protein [Nocardioidaceae bacterium]
MTSPVNPSKTMTTAFFAQAAISFAVAMLAVVLGICYLPVDGWMRAFLALGSLFLVTSTFTLAKCVRDAQDQATLGSRLDQARLDRILAEHDPFREVA